MAQITSKQHAWTAVALCAVAGVALMAGHAGAQRSVNQQQVYVSVVDKKGTPAASLLPTDLTIKEDGTSREVLTVKPATGPMDIALLVDTSAATASAVVDIREALKNFAAAIWAKSPESQIALYTFGERPTLDSDFSSSAVALNRRLDRLFSSSGSGAYFVDAVVDVATVLAKRKSARPTMVAYVDENGPDFSNRRHDHASDAVAASRASLWTVTRQGFGSSGSTQESRERSMVIGDVPTRSGGRGTIVFDGTGIKVRLADVAAQLLSQFEVTYGRPESLIPPERIDVKLTNPDLRLAAPRWTGK
jgi:hypothetical protein